VSERRGKEEGAGEGGINQERDNEREGKSRQRRSGKGETAGQIEGERARK
jgi:hypothetical protein